MVDAKSLLMGDDAADLLVRLAVLLGQTGSADSVEIAAIESGGNAGRITFLLNGGASITTESVTSDLVAPENSKAEQYMISRIVEIERSLHPSFEDLLGVDPDPDDGW